MSKRKSFNVSLRSQSVKVYPWTHTGTGKEKWRFAWHDTEKGWRYITRATKSDAKSAAENLMREAELGLEWTALSPGRRRFLEQVHRLCNTDDEEEVVKWLEERKDASSIGAALSQFKSFKIESAGEETRHLKSTFSILEKMRDGLNDAMLSDVSAAELKAWWDVFVKDLGSGRKSFIRSAIVQFWTWTKKNGLSPAVLYTVADKLPSVAREDGKKEILTVEQMEALMAQVHPRYRSAVILGGFGGFRPEEVAPRKDKKSKKRGLLAQDIDWDFKVIRVPKEVSKTGRERIVPFNPALEAGLAWAGIGKDSVGALCASNMSEDKETLRLAPIFGGKWPQDALRHTYGSMRNALLRSLDQVAEEMGTSVKMLHSNYHNPRAEKEGELWFSILPSEEQDEPAKLA